MMKKIIILGMCMVLIIPAVNAAVWSNDPPDIPTIDGPLTGKTGNSYEYEFCGSDPNGDDITICYSWGDGTGEVCVGPFPSGTCIKVNHTWTKDGTYDITAYARDIHGLESEEATLRVEMPYVNFRLFTFMPILEVLYNNIVRILSLFN
jgi:hypothetical protein